MSERAADGDSAWCLVVKVRRIDQLEPFSHEHLNDFGWLLDLDGNLRKAEEVLERAVALVPDDGELPRNNPPLVRECTSDAAAPQDGHRQ